MDNTTELIAYAWQYKMDELEDKILSGKYNVLKLYFYHEYEFLVTSEKIINFINENKIKIFLVTCSSEIADFSLLNKINPELLTFQPWDTFWLTRTHLITTEVNKIYNQINNNDHKYNFVYPFATFNGKSKPHRTKFIDKLFEQQLENAGIITYHQTTGLQDEYNPEYYKNQILTIDDNFTKDQFSYNFNNMFLQSFLHIPTESATEVFLLSEKTATPILCKLPFLTLGCVNYHKKLQEMGFKIYDEIFDYSFDSEPDIDVRIQLLTKNINYVMDQKENLNTLYDKIKHKLEYNRNKALEIIKNYSLVPSLIKERYTVLHNSKYIDGVDRELMNISNLFYNEIENFAIENYKERNPCLIYDLWHNFDIKQVIRDINDLHPEKIIILGENEWEPWVVENFVNAVNKYNVEVVYITGAPESEFLNNLVKSFNIQNFELQHWPTYHLMYASRLLKDINNQYKNTFKYSFICLNNRDHLHRCALIDHLEKYNLIKEDSVVTWHSYIKENTNYKFKYFDKRNMIIDDNFNKTLDSYQIPKQYFESFFDIVSECAYKTIMISEKTVKPLFYKKPFIVFGAPGFHRYLQQLGFELYDEIIDYSFDSENDLEKRANLFAREIKKITKIKNRKQVYKQLKKKINKNYKQLFKLAADKSFIPKQTQFLMLDVNDCDQTHYVLKYKEVLNYMESIQ
jgi:hypothetical protein